VTGLLPVTVARAGSAEPAAPLVVLLHGRGSSERDIIGLADHLPAGPAYAAVRAPIAEGGGFAWFANRGIGRPVAESLAQTMAWFRAWLDDVAPEGRPVVMLGVSGGAAFAGGLVLADPDRFAGAAILYGTLPFDAAVPVSNSSSVGSIGRLYGGGISEKACGGVQQPPALLLGIATGGPGLHTNALAHLVLTVNYGLTVQATTGATRSDLEDVADAVVRDWPST